MFNQVHLTALAGMKSFSFGDFFMTNQDSGCPLGEEAMRKRLRGLVKSGEVVRVGRNAYCVSGNKMSSYRHEYSEEANTVAQALREAFPAVEFTIFELVQLNEFVNHQLAHNVLFLSVEDDIIDFVFDLLKEQFPGKVLLDPTPELYHQYWYDGMIVLNKLVTEAPRGIEEAWHTRLEKLLVDLVSDSLLQEVISKSEYPAILERTFSGYVIDESCLFRYAKRRGAEKQLKALIREKTNITLRTE